MAFNLGAALTSAGEIAPALTSAQEAERERKDTIARLGQESTARDLANQQSRVNLDRSRAAWTPIRSYTRAGAQHTIYLTPTGYQDIEEQPDPIAERQRVLKQLSQSPDTKQLIQGLTPEEIGEYTLSGKFPTRAGVMPPKVQTRVADSSFPSGFAQVEYNPYTGEEYSRVPWSPTGFGAIPQETSSSRYDPLTGTTSTTESIRRPMLGGGTATPTAPSSTPETLKRLGQPPSATPSPARPGSPAIGALGLDPEGHIPPSRTTPEPIRAAANDILDGVDITKINARVRPLAESLARRYGWQGQGLFSPKEKLQLQIVQPFLQRAITSKSLDVLNSAQSRLKLSEFMSDKPSLIGRTFRSLAPLSPDESEFLRLRNQLLGVVNGLAGLTRGGKVGTEAAVQRLIQEMPNPLTHHSGEEARDALKKAMSELAIAEKAGRFDAGGTEGGEGNSTPKVGDIKTFPNGRKGKWDGTGWEAQ